MRDRFFPTKTREEIETDNRDELDAWIDERASALIEEGLPPDDARRRALEEFSGSGSFPSTSGCPHRCDRGTRTSRLQ